MTEKYPLEFNVDYPKKDLDKLSTFFRPIFAIPILIIQYLLASGVGFLFVPTALMIAAVQKYPRWWFDWNFNLLKFQNRVGVYLALMTDIYPSTDQDQYVHLKMEYPDVKKLNRYMPLVKWFLAIPHYIVLGILSFVVIFAVIVAWFSILFTGKYPKQIFNFMVGYGRWANRVTVYSLLLTTDKYPPFSLD